ncbi:MAG: PadR family transcriptional regulator [Haloechinothrix sp.]
MSDLNATSAALLGLLQDGAATGGQLVARAGAGFGAFFSVTRSQVYRELPELAEKGLLRLGKRGARSSQQYMITPAGKKAFRQWVNDEAGPDHLRSPLILRLVHATAVTDKQRKALIESARERYNAEFTDAKAAAKAADDASVKAVAEFAQSHAKAALRLIEAIEKA